MEVPVTLGTTELLAVVAMLTAITLLLGILGKTSGWLSKRVHDIMGHDLSDIQTSLKAIKASVAKVDALEVRQIALVSQLDNGIKDRLDDLEQAHLTSDTKMDGLATDLAHLTGMLELHLNWQGPDRRGDDD